MDNLNEYFEVVGELCKTHSPGILSFDKESIYVKFGILTLNCEVENPRFAFAKGLMFWEQPEEFEEDINRNFVNTNTSLPEFWEIGSHCVIGDRGFGIVDHKGERIQMPHHGNVSIQDGVIIRNHVCIDRAVLGTTYVGPNTAIDNFVHIAHGVQIGQRCIITAHAVIGGSAIIGDDVFIGIGATIKNKIKIGNNVTIGAGAVVVKDVPDGITVVGNPAADIKTKGTVTVKGADIYEAIKRKGTA